MNSVPVAVVTESEKYWEKSWKLFFISRSIMNIASSVPHSYSIVTLSTEHASLPAALFYI